MKNPGRKPSFWLFACAIILFSMPGRGIAQEQNVYVIHDQLDQNVINSFKINSQGFMWIATEEGLHRFDGYDFISRFPLRTDSGMERNLELLFEDNHGNLWLKNADGELLRFCVAKEIFHRYKLTSGHKKAKTIHALFNSRRNSLWVGTDLGLFGYSKEDDSFYKIVAPNGPADNYINRLGLDAKENLWIGTRNGLWAWDIRADKFHRYMTDPDDWTTLSMNNILSIEKDYSGTLWIGTMWGINKVIPTGDTYPADVSFKRIIPDAVENSDNFINTITPHPSGDIWITTNRGVLRMTGANEKSPYFSRYLEFPLVPNPSTVIAQPIFDSLFNVYFLYNIHPKGVYYYDYATHRMSSIGVDFSSLLDSEQEFLLQSIFIDPTNVLWVGIEKRGFLRYNLGRKPFKVSLSEKDIYDIYKHPDGRIFAGSRSGLNIFYPNQNLWQLVTPDNNSSMPRKFPGTLRSFNHQELWVGFWDGLLSVYNMEKDLFLNYEYLFDDPSSLRTWSVREVFEDAGGNIWIGGAEAGLTLLAHRAGLFRYFDSHTDESRNYPEPWLASIIQDREGVFWLGARQNGLIRFCPSDSTFISYPLIGNNGQVINYEVKSIWQDPEGYLWVATRSTGLMRFHIQKETFTVFGPENGLSSVHIKSMIADDRHQLWLGTRNGLSRFDIRSHRFYNFFRADGLPSDDFNDGACFRDKEGNLYFGTNRGLVVFHPGEVIPQPFNPGVALTNAYVFNEQVEIDSTYSGRVLVHRSVSLTDTLTFNYRHKMISFGFAAFHFIAPEQVKYYYRLDGFDNQWREAPANTRRATYTNLKPGRYTFRVKTTNAGGVESPHTLSVHVHVLTPWFQSAWFRIMLLLLLFAMVFSFYRIRLLQLKKQKARLEKTVETRTHELMEANRRLQMQKDEIQTQKTQLEQQASQLKEADYFKTRFFINISHELRTPLTLILSPIDSLLKKAKKSSQENLLGLMKKNAHRLMLLIDQLLDIRKMETGNKTIELSMGNLAEYAGNIVDLFRDAAREKNIKMSFIHHDLLQEQVLFDRDAIDKIIHNLLSNAIKYTPNHQTITFELKTSGEQHFEMVVINTGVGIPEEKRKEVFRRFYHHDPMNENIGFGIGLSYVKDLVDIYNGTIVVSSEPDEYTLFSVTLPLIQNIIPNVRILEQAEQEEPWGQLSGGKDPDKSGSKDAKGKAKDIVCLSSELLKEDDADGLASQMKDPEGAQPLVLIVEDNAGLASYLAMELQAQYNVLTAPEGATGLEMAFEHIPDLIISDLMMPLMNGNELCARLKTDIRTSHIPLVLLTARSDTHDQIEGLKTGADDYLTKPFNIELLKARLASLLRNRKLLAEKITSPAGVSMPQLNDLDTVFIEKCRKIINENIFNPQYGYDSFFGDLNMSKSNCYRKIKALTGKSPGEFILIEKMNIAAGYLASRQYTPTELAYEMGYNSPSNFSRDFKKVIKKSPKQFGNSPI